MKTRAESSANENVLKSWKVVPLTQSKPNSPKELSHFCSLGSDEGYINAVVLLLSLDWLGSFVTQPFKLRPVCRHRMLEDGGKTSRWLKDMAVRPK
jgi:hypothetical protein